MKHPLVCSVCCGNFESVQVHARYCSSDCRKSSERERWGRTSDGSLSSGTVGALAELACSVDLMEKGYAVFRALSPACICDLIAFKDGKFLRVEVRTGYKGEADKISFPMTPKDKGRQDIFAVYIRSRKEVEYFNPDKQKTQV